MLKRLVNEARFTLTVTTTGPILVRSGHASVSGPDMTPVRTFRNGQWEVYVPGSSLKGVVRSHIEKVARTLNDRPGGICNPFSRIPGAPDMFCGEKFELRKKNRDPSIVGQQVNQTVYGDSCPACRLFGSTWFIGRISIEDAHLASGSQSRTELRDGVGIDRLTGGAANGAKFELEAVSAEVSFETTVSLRNFECWQLGALLLVAQDLEDGLIRVGSGRSRGLGAVQGAIDNLVVDYIGAPCGRPATEVWGLGKHLGDGTYGTQPDDLLTVDHPPSEERQGIRLRASFVEQSLADLRKTALGAFVGRVQSWPVPAGMLPKSRYLQQNSAGGRP